MAAAKEVLNRRADVTEAVAASVLDNDDDPSRIKLCGLQRRGWHSWGQFVRHLGLDPDNMMDLEDSLAFSRGCALLDDFFDFDHLAPKVPKVQPLPTKGRWIKWIKRREGKEKNERKCKIVDNLVVDAKETLTFKDAAGRIGILNLTQLQFLTWNYCDGPGQEEMEKEKYKRLNMEIGNRCCHSCQTNSKKLQICTECSKIYYCDATCQLDDWENHKPLCKQEMTVLKPNPRYPLSQARNNYKAWKEIEQIEVQAEQHKLLFEGLAGNFTVQGTEAGAPCIHNPKSQDLESGKNYKLRVNNEEFDLKWVGLEPSNHSLLEGNPNSCTVLRCLDLKLKHVQETNYNLHYLVLHENYLFWWMVINFNTFNTVAPFHGSCRCNPSNVKGQMSLRLREIRKKFNIMLKRAKADMMDVQCMYSNHEDACLNYMDCPYKHQIEEKKVEKEIKEKKYEKCEKQQILFILMLFMACSSIFINSFSIVLPAKRNAHK